MAINSYELSVDRGFQEFFFESEGPKGKIKKKVVFTAQNSIDGTYFNIAFGDVDEATGDINDLSISNNQDREKILATVATAVLLFLDKFPYTTVYATGSTPARTRLYQMSISTNFHLIEPHLEIFGFARGQWEKFSRAERYAAFLAVKKIGRFTF